MLRRNKPEKEFFDILKEKKNYKRRQQYRDNTWYVFDVERRPSVNAERISA